LLLTAIAVKLLAIKAALETISGASYNLLISSTRELCKANAAIAKALLYLSQSSVSDTDRVEVEVWSNISSEHADLANL
jgi:hypothetical protein